jgi:indole-3-glycerol phosphate synthase
LIVEAIGIERVAALAPIARDLGMGVIVEVHSEPDLLAVLGRLGPPDSGAYLIGINNRDLKVQRTDLATMSRLSRQLPDGTRFIAESGIQSRKDVLKACRAGAGAVLVGESILRARDMGAKIDELLGR